MRWFGTPLPGVDTREHLGLIAHLSLRLFLIFAAYYLMKPVREALVLSERGAELRSYGLSIQAVVIMVLFPLYVMLSNKMVHERLYRAVTLFFCVSLLGFIVAIDAGLHVGLSFFVWSGIFSAVQVVQFWSLATDFATRRNCQFVVPWIAVGGCLGALVGAMLARMLESSYAESPELILGLSLGLLLISLIGTSSRPASREEVVADPSVTVAGALLFRLRRLARARYIRLVFLFVLLLNMLNTIGEYYLAHLVLQRWHGDREAIGMFYADYFLVINIMTLLMQLLIVPWFCRHHGLGVGLLLVIVVNLMMFGVGLMFPTLLSLFTLAKCIENGVGYSFGNTVRQLLFAPLGQHSRYHGMMLVNGLSWRIGDALQGVVVFAVVEWMGLPKKALLFVGLLLTMVWLVVVMQIRPMLDKKAKSSDGSPSSARQGAGIG